MQKRWKILTADQQKVNVLQRSLKIHPVICKILIQRGIETFEQAKDFFRPQLTALHSPWLMKDMDKAVERVTRAVNLKEKILVFGDYDVDGTTAVASMYQFLKKIHSNLDFYIPHRYREGYGISKAGIDFAKANGFSLIISLDCGIKSADLIGCGVGFKLMCALSEKMQLPENAAFEYLDLLATAIAADIVPVAGENRILAFHGLIKANKNPNYGIRALSKLSGLVKDLHITNLVFMIAPKVNAAGRMDDARKAVQMFVANTEEEALLYAEQLHSDNTDRKEADKSITEEALALIHGKEEWIKRKSTLVFQPHWHKGVVGIVASRLIEHHYRPTIVLTQSGEYAAGSARSVPGFNLYEAIHACREHLLGYGGHFAAAGMTLELEKVDAFREKFEEIVSSTIQPELLIPEIIIDAEISLKDIKQTFYDIISQMEPYGPENLRPVFITRNVINSGYSKIVKEEHIRFSLREDNFIMNGIGFGMAGKFHLLDNQQPIDIVYTIDENEWNETKSLQLKVIDIQSTQP